MKPILINKNTKIYVLCPAYIKTGGPELLHQLVKELNKNKIEAYITYYGIKKNNREYTNEDFKKYVTDYKIIKNIEDTKDNIIITPEVVPAIKITKKMKNMRKIIWWLSVDNFNNCYGLINPLKTYGALTTLKFILKRQLIYSFSYIQKIDYHFCQSHYAIDFLEKKGINSLYLSDYISDEYLNINEKSNMKKDIIAYNPKKGREFTKKIIAKSPHLKFVPIQNLTTTQVKELLLESKVYIDFGNHPGKDRIPRESAMCGCCIITNKKGSAKYYEDVPINYEFKFEDNEKNIENIIEKINECITNYDYEILKFTEYIQFIKNEKKQFKNDIKKIFKN